MSAEGGLGAAEPLAATSSTNGNHTGWQPGPGVSRARTALAPGPRISLPASRSPEMYLPQDGGNDCSPRACHFPREGRVLPVGGAGTAPQGLGAEPEWMAIASARQLGSEMRWRNAYPAPIGAPVRSPQSPSFALLQQHLGLSPSRAWEKLRKRALFPEPAGTVETLPESSTAWKSITLVP